MSFSGLQAAAGEGESAPAKLAVCDDREAEIELEANDRGNGGVFARAQLVCGTLSDLVRGARVE